MIAIPERLKIRPRDRRGYPIPYAVFIEEDGTPQFTVNDMVRMEEIKHRDLCSLCGTRLLRGRWFLGGPASAFLPNGAYLDMPMHDECAHYALQACPYLALPKFAREIGEKKAAHIKDAILITEQQMIEGRPGVFVAVMAVSQKFISDGRLVKPTGTYRKVEYWRHGARISLDEAAPYIEAAIREALEVEAS